ncbi:hypothetical protein EV421DRAFT_824416 [Armillaria borealis]|uniref:Uncharacterized protein n=1 Tax=Armillaria borealis TaxID=47425 RepID=A0AA39JDI7_9AGAR|nr:hypothetical protein EV421DRAFT_824416 [Armillaria borealis]
MISSIPTVSFSSVNLSVPLPVIRKRQSVTVASTEDDPTVPPRPIKRSTGSILRAKRLTAVNTISRPFIARRSKSQSPTTTTESDRPFIRVTRSAQSIFKSKEQEPSDDTQPPVTTANKISRVLRSKYQRVTTDTMARPVMLVKRSAQSIFRSKKPRDLNPESVVTIQELEDVVSLHPLSVYSPSFPSEEKPESEESSETSSLLSESSPTTSSTASVALGDSIETTSLARVPSTTSAVVVISESAVPANSSHESYRWMVMMFMLTIIGVSSEFLLRRHY